MTTKSKFERWMAMLTGPCIAVAMLLFAAGMVLIGLVHLPHTTGQSSHLLLGCFLLYSSAALTVSTIIPKKVSSGSGNYFASLFLGELALLILGFIQAGLAMEALFSDPIRPEYAPLLIASCLSLALTNALDIFDKESRRTEIEEENEEDDDEYDETDDVEPIETRASAWDTIVSFAVAALYGALYAIPALLWLCTLGWLYYRLRSEMFEGVQFVAATELKSLTSALLNALPILLAVLSTIFAVTMGAGLLLAGARWVSRLLKK